MSVRIPPGFEGRFQSVQEEKQESQLPTVRAAAQASLLQIQAFAQNSQIPPYAPPSTHYQSRTYTRTVQQPQMGYTPYQVVPQPQMSMERLIIARQQLEQQLYQ
jgi:hypothetical protein